MKSPEKMLTKPMHEDDDTGPQGNWGRIIPEKVPDVHPGVVEGNKKPELPAQTPLRIEIPPEDWRPYPEERPEDEKPEHGHTEIDYRILK